MTLYDPNAAGYGAYPDTQTNRRRWSLSVQAAAKALHTDIEDPTTVFYAHLLYQSDIPTSGSVADDETGDQANFALVNEVDIGLSLEHPFQEFLHPRTHGKFAKKYAMKVAEEAHKRSGEATGDLVKAASKGAESLPKPKAATANIPDPAQDPLLRLGPVTSGNVRMAIDQIPTDVRAKIDQWPPERGPWADHVLGGSFDTQRKYTTKRYKNKNVYKPERARLHESIMQLLLRKAGAGAYSPTPEAHFMAGGPGVGKSTMVPKIDTLPDHVYIDSDEIKKHLPEYQMLLHPSWTPEQIGAELERLAHDETPTPASTTDPPDPYAAAAVHEETTDIARGLFQYAMENNYNVVLDGTGNDKPGRFATKLKSAARTHQVHVHYVYTPVEDALARSIGRAQGDGRWLSPRFVVETHQHVSRNFRDDVQHVPGIGITIYDATHRSDAPEVVAHADPIEGETPAERLMGSAGPAFNDFLRAGHGA